jgi:hypothetical protein
MSDFSKEISEFQKMGTYDYIFDEGGNLVFNSSSSEFNQNYVSIPLADYAYNLAKITSFYDLDFKEFIPTVTVIDTAPVVSSEVTQLTQENQDLRTKLDVLTATSDANITESEKLAIKQIILDLRIQLKQGIADRDFSTTFPYLPLTKPTR